MLRRYKATIDVSILAESSEEAASRTETLSGRIDDAIDDSWNCCDDDAYGEVLGHATDIEPLPLTEEELAEQAQLVAEARERAERLERFSQIGFPTLDLALDGLSGVVGRLHYMKDAADHVREAYGLWIQVGAHAATRLVRPNEEVETIIGTFIDFVEGPRFCKHGTDLVFPPSKSPCAECAKEMKWILDGLRKRPVA